MAGNSRPPEGNPDGERAPAGELGREGIDRLRRLLVNNVLLDMRLRKVLVTVAAGGLIVAGLVMLVTPGPGIVSILAGFILLAGHYIWARRVVCAVEDEVVEVAERLGIEVEEARCDEIIDKMDKVLDFKLDEYGEGEADEQRRGDAGSE